MKIFKQKLILVTTLIAIMMGVGCKKESSDLKTPKVITIPVSLISQTGGLGGGEVTDQGGSTVISRGLCWSSHPNPSLLDSFSNEGGGIGAFSTQMEHLTPGALYYVRAYASNQDFTVYGNQVSFMTVPSIGPPPTVSTISIQGISKQNAVLHGFLTAEGGSPVSSMGFCISRLPHPSLEDTLLVVENGIGDFEFFLTDLDSSTSYYVCAFAVNEAGASLGTELSFRTLDGSNGNACPGFETIIDIDGNIYNTIQIGNQCWMKENLRTTRYSNGVAILHVPDDWALLQKTEKAYCSYDNSAANSSLYGNLYTWAAAMNGLGTSHTNPSGVQGPCPDGWHLPGDSEWKALEEELGMIHSEVIITGWRGTDEGGKLKEPGLSHWANPNKVATINTGFLALPGGYRTSGGAFQQINRYGFWWTATEYSYQTKFYRSLFHSNTQIHRNSESPKVGLSIRCVKNP